MKPIFASLSLLAVSIALLLTLAGCSTAHGDQAAEAPPAPNVVPAPDAALFSVDHAEQFPLAAATQHPTTSELVVTGAVTPDVARNIPVVSRSEEHTSELQSL